MIVPLSEWYPAMAQKWTGDPVPRADREAWVHHHTAGGTGQNPLSYARGVADFHYQKWGVPGGYGFLIGEDAVAREMCGYDSEGVHSGTHYWNEHGIGLAYQGDFRNSPPTDAMLDTARQVMAEIPMAQSYHRAVRPTFTECPGDALIALLPLETDMALSQEDKDFIIAAVTGDNVDQTNSVWQRYAIRNNAGDLVPLIDAIQFIYRKLETGSGTSAKAVADELARRLDS